MEFKKIKYNDQEILIPISIDENEIEVNEIENTLEQTIEIKLINGDNNE